MGAGTADFLGWRDLLLLWYDTVYGDLVLLNSKRDAILFQPQANEKIRELGANLSSHVAGQMPKPGKARKALWIPLP